MAFAFGEHNSKLSGRISTNAFTLKLIRIAQGSRTSMSGRMSLKFVAWFLPFMSCFDGAGQLDKMQPVERHCAALCADARV